MRDFRGNNDKVKRAKRLPRALSPALINIAEKLDEKERDEIAEIVLQDFEYDDASRREWLDMHAEWVRVYYQKDRPANAPWAGSSEESLGLLTEACNQFQARAKKAFFPHRLPITAIPVNGMDPELSDRASRVGKHLSWQLMVKNRNYKRDKTALLLGTPIHGSVFTKTFFDPVMNRVVVRNVRAVDLVVRYTIGPVPIEEVPCKTEVIFSSLNDTRIRAAAGYYLHPCEPFTMGDDRSPTRAHDEAHGIVLPVGDELHPACILEQHRTLDLDGDGIEEPYIAWVDRQSRKLLRLQIRYETDASGRPTNGKEPVEQYTHYGFLSNPDGFYQLGLGHLIAKSNIAVNKLLRQFIDACTLSNVGNMSGFVSEILAGNKGEVALELGKFKTVSASSEDIQKGLKTLSFPAPSPAIIDILRMIDQRSQRVSSVTDLVAGESDKVLQPTTVQTLVEQSQMLFSSIQDDLLTCWGEELQKVYDLNRQYMFTPERMTVDGPNGFESVEIYPDDYTGDHMVMPVSDPRMANQAQRQKKAEFLYKFSLENPLIAGNPKALLETSRDVLKAMEVEGVDRILPRTVEELPRQGAPPDPKIVEAEMKDKREREFHAKQYEMDLSKSATDAQLERTKHDLLTQKTNAELRIQHETAMAKIAADKEIAMAKLAVDERCRQDEMRMQAQTATNKAKLDADAKVNAAVLGVNDNKEEKPESDNSKDLIRMVGDLLKAMAQPKTFNVQRGPNGMTVTSGGASTGASPAAAGSSAQGGDGDMAAVLKELTAAIKAERTFTISRGTDGTISAKRALRE